MLIQDFLLYGFSSLSSTKSAYLLLNMRLTLFFCHFSKFSGLTITIRSGRRPKIFDAE